MRTHSACAALLLVSCSFDATVPSTVVVRCLDGACPQGFVCKSRLGVCVPTSGQTTGEAPRIVSSRVTPDVVKDGSPVEVTFTVSAALAVRPSVSVVTAQGARPADFVSQSGADYVYGFVATRSLDGEGVARILADLVDLSGTEASSQPVGLVELDATPPRIRDATITAPRGVDPTGELSVRGGELVSLRVTLSEPVQPQARITVAPDCDGGLAFALRAAEGAALDFGLVTPSRGCSTAVLTLDGVADRVGNAMPPTALSPRVTVDGTPPEIRNLRTLRPVDGGLVPQSVFSRAPGFDRYVVSFEVDSTAVILTTRFDATTLAGCGCDAGACSCTAQVQADQTEGEHSVSVVATDGAGNSSTGYLPLRFDFSPPQLEPLSTSLTLNPAAGCPVTQPTALGTGARLRATFSLTEPPSSVSMEATPPALRFTANTVTPTLVTFTGALLPSPAQGPVALWVIATDAVGNTGRLSLGLSTEIDTTAPAAPDVMAADAIVLRREPWGARDAGARFLVRGAPGAVETTAVQVGSGTTPLALADVTDAGFSVALPAPDRDQVWVAAIDSACNLSPRADVKNVEWLATLNGKLPGRTFENPNLLTVRDGASNATTQLGARERAPLPLRQDGVLRWEQRSLRPAPRLGAVLAYDAERQRLLAFGGQDASGPLGDLWAWDAPRQAWTRVTPAAGQLSVPSPRMQPALGYDPVRQRLTLFGGMTTGGRNDELWEWDGVARLWTNRTPSPRPPSWPAARFNASFVYDEARQRLVLLGGEQVLGVGGLDVWELDGASGTWTNRTPAPLPTAWPNAQYYPRAVWDSARSVIVLYGGANSRQLWEWNGTSGTWTNRTPTPLPSVWPTVTMLTGLAYDAARQRTVLFGGMTTNGVSCGTCRNELWEWDGAAGTWANRTPASLPTAWPTPRAYHAMAYDPGAGRVVVFAGQDSAAELEQVWHWSGAAGTWTNATPASAQPSNRTGAALAFDSTRGALVFFGGYTGVSTYSRETWEWSQPLGWRNRTPVAGPSARSGFVTYDSARARTVLLGSGVAGDDYWEWSADAGTWTNRPATTRPTVLSSVVVYDSARRKVVLFGGFDLSQPTYGLDRLWEWDTTDGGWTDRTPTVRPAEWPGPRWDHALAYDELRGRVVLFGGARRGGHYNDVREWDGTAWVDRTPTPLPASWPSVRQNASATYDSARGVVLVMGGQTTSASLRDLWEWDGATGTWRQRQPDVFDPEAPRLAPSFKLVYDTSAKRALYYGGEVPPYEVGFSELWEWGVDSLSRPAVVAQVPFALSGAEGASTVTSVTVNAIGGATSGAELLASLGDVMVPEASNAAPVGSPASLTWRTTDPTRIARLLEGPERRISVAVRPRTNNANGTLATVALDWVEVLVAYRRP